MREFRCALSSRFNVISSVCTIYYWLFESKRRIYLGNILMLETVPQTLSPLLAVTDISDQSAFTFFAFELWNVNAELINGNLPKSVLHEFVTSWGPTASLLQGAMCFLSVLAILIAQKMHKKKLLRNLILAFAELMAISIFLTPAFLPFKSARFVCGLLSFALFMSLHSKILAVETSKASFVGQLLNALSFNTREHLTIKTNPSLPSQSLIIRYVILLACLDGCTYLITELIPISLSNNFGRIIAINVITGFWAYFSLEFHYTQAIIFCNFLGYQLPMKLRHSNPFMSVSLSEFWGVRWNPIICKLLQSSFYVPFRKLGVPRFICVMSCFLGSGLLHAIPVYISSYSMKNAILMGSFFLFQGVLVLVEQIFCARMGWTLKPANIKSNNIDAIEDAATASKLFSYIGDMSLMIGSFLLFFYTVQGKATIVQLTILLGCFFISSSAVLHAQLGKVMKQYAADADCVKVVDAASLTNELKDITDECNQSKSIAASKAKVLTDSFNSVADVGQLSQASSRYPSFTSSEKCLDITQPVSMDAAKIALLQYSEKNLEKVGLKIDCSIKRTTLRTIRTAIWILCGWLWTASMIALPLPLFCLPLNDIMSSLFHQSIVIGPVVRSMQYLKWV